MATKSENSGRGEVWVIAQIILLAAILLSPHAEEWPDGLRSVSVVVRIIIAVIGLAVVAMSAANLGGNLTIFPRPLESGKLTRRGIYGLVRHPMYLGVILCALGWAVFRTSTLGLILVMVLGVFFDAKARREEVWLAEKYPDYAEYQREVRKLLPFIY